MAVSSSPSVQVKENIELSDTEEKIFDWLLGTLLHFGLNNQLRVAGGWGRDKQKYGTAEEDAYRRDLTISSLFYNINTSSVEDYTKSGFEDLKFGRIVTPLPPKDTFMDDPLRVLRAIHFGARFEFILDEELKKTAASEDVKSALAAKISRERVGTEVDLMIAGNQPVKAKTYIYDLNLFWVVFSLPSEFKPAMLEGHDRLGIAYWDAMWNLIRLIGWSTFSASYKTNKGGSPSMLLCSYHLEKLRTKIRKEKKKIPIANHILRESLKRKASNAETVMNVHNATEKFLFLIPYIVSNEDVQKTDIEEREELVNIPVTSLLRVITGLEKVWAVEPLVNGKEIMSFLQLQSGGPLVREWQQKLLGWQLAHPSGTAEECLEWMKQTHSKLAKAE